jgi:hypothetical protein
VSTTLTNLNDQFSYIVQVPCENILGGFTPSSNTLALSSSPRFFNRSQVTISGTYGTYTAYLVSPALNNISLSAFDRGRLEQVNLVVSIPLTDLDLNGLPDDWERFYFGHIGVDPKRPELSLSNHQDFGRSGWWFSYSMVQRTQ